MKNLNNIAKSNILEDAIYRFSIGNKQSLTLDRSKGLYSEETNNPTAKHFKSQLFPNFTHKRLGFPEIYKAEYLVFRDGQIAGISWDFEDKQSLFFNLYADEMELIENRQFACA
tara:strand:+ start:672 stop:1013 length:342 start_codon:yes stop_codon:yes gene_type:complete